MHIRFCPQIFLPSVLLSEVSHQQTSKAHRNQGHGQISKGLVLLMKMQGSTQAQGRGRLPPLDGFRG